MLTKILPCRPSLPRSIGNVEPSKLTLKQPRLPPPVPHDDLSARISKARSREQLVQYFKQGSNGEHPISRACTPREYLVLLQLLIIPARRTNHQPNQQVAVERVLHLFHVEARHQRKSKQEPQFLLPSHLVLCYNNLAWAEPFPRHVPHNTRRSQMASKKSPPIEEKSPHLVQDRFSLPAITNIRKEPHTNYVIDEAQTHTLNKNALVPNIDEIIIRTKKAIGGVALWD